MSEARPDWLTGRAVTTANGRLLALRLFRPDVEAHRAVKALPSIIWSKKVLGVSNHLLLLLRVRN